MTSEPICCPKEDCNRSFDSERGMKAHVLKGHGDRGILLESRVCPNCEKEFEIRKSRDRAFCSPSCSSLAQHYMDSDEFQSATPDSRTSAEWERKRKEVLERDGFRCQSCGISNDKHIEEKNEGLHVHHVQPARTFGEDGVIDYEKSERLENLVTMCKSCHQKWEKIGVRPVLVG